MLACLCLFWRPVLQRAAAFCTGDCNVVFRLSRASWVSRWCSSRVQWTIFLAVTKTFRSTFHLCAAFILHNQHASWLSAAHQFNGTSSFLSMSLSPHGRKVEWELSFSWCRLSAPVGACTQTYLPQSWALLLWCCLLVFLMCTEVCHGCTGHGEPMVRLLTEEVRPHPLGALCRSFKECDDKSWTIVDKERPCLAPLLFQVAPVCTAMVATRLSSLRLVMLVYLEEWCLTFRKLGWGSGGGTCLPPTWGGRWSGSRISWGTSPL